MAHHAAGLDSAGQDDLGKGETRRLMDHHIDTLFRCDADGRLRHVNELGAPAAPRVYMGRSCHGNVWRVRYDLPEPLVQEIDRLCRDEPVAAKLADMPHVPRHAAAIRAMLHAHAPVTRETSGPAYWSSADAPIPPHVMPITRADVDLLRDGFDWMATELRQTDPAVIGPVMAAVVDDKAVALCFCSRLPRAATEAGVETLPAWRGQGHATAAVAGWVAAVRRLGILPLYSTSWDNLASQRIARKLNMLPYGADWWLQ